MEVITEKKRRGLENAGSPYFGKKGVEVSALAKEDRGLGGVRLDDERRA